ncbi:4-oxalocrotonate tautomerase family enzyme [Sporosarcina luteola]|nr:4-oxalocrotonate tautomerase family enzyme [Sporosarcina luteola]
MPIIHVDCWEGFNAEQKTQWIKELTDVTVSLFNLPPDKVLVVLKEVPVTNWGQAGVVASDPDFLAKSRITEASSIEKHVNNKQ